MEKGPDPSDSVVRVHATKEGAICGGIVMLGITMGGSEIIDTTTEFPDSQTLLAMPPEELQDHSTEILIRASPIVAGLLAGVVVYKKISNRIRRNGGSYYIGFQEPEEITE